jgi:glycosyltransferase involved in cell wall biosynthesis
VRILLDTTFLQRGPGGTATYLRHLAPALREEGVEVIEAANQQRRPPAGGGAGSWLNLAGDAWWSGVELPRRAAAVGADVLHHPLPALARWSPCPQVVTVHDVAFERLPECFDPRFRAVARRAHRRAARGAAAVVCVSETTADDVRALWGVSGDRVVVARHGAGQDPSRGDSARQRPGHFLYVGDDEPRKNLPLLLAGHRLYRERTGPEAPPLPLVLAGAIAGSPDGARVERLPPSARLAELYDEAAALVLPSLHEGFGLPALEAMTAGVPVLAARSPGIWETCGDAAEYFDPRDPEALAGALAVLATEGERRRDLSERGRRRAAAFSWRRAARAHLEGYTLAVER